MGLVMQIHRIHSSLSKLTFLNLVVPDYSHIDNTAAGAYLLWLILPSSQDSEK